MEMDFSPATLPDHQQLLLLYSPFPASFVVLSSEVWSDGGTQVSPGHDGATQSGEIHGLLPTVS